MFFEYVLRTLQLLEPLFSVTPFVIVLLSVLIKLILDYVYSSRKRPPGPWGLPILGYYPFLLGNTVETVQALTDKYGSIFGLNVLCNKVYFLNDLATMREAFVRNKEVTSDRPDGFNVFTYTLTDKAIAASSRHHWAFHRKLITKYVLTSHSIRRHLPKMNVAIDRMVSRINKMNGQPFDPFKALMQFSLDTTSSLIYGQMHEPDSELSDQLINMAKELFNIQPGIDGFITGKLLFLISWLRLNAYGRVRKLIKKSGEHFYPIIDERMKTEVKEPASILDEYVKRLQKLASKDEILTRSTTYSNLYNMLEAGVETTSTTLHHALSYMILYPDVQANVQKEIDERIGDRSITLEDKVGLHYTNAVIAEMLRFTAVAPFGVFHLASSKIHLGGYEIEKGSILIPNIYSVLRSKSYFEKPDEFYPGHFLDQNGNFVQNPANIPFGVGRRMCVAYKLAETQVFLAFATLMQRFTWQTSTGEPFRREVMPFFTLTLKPYIVRAIPR